MISDSDEPQDTAKDIRPDASSPPSPPSAPSTGGTDTPSEDPDTDTGASSTDEERSGPPAERSDPDRRASMAPMRAGHVPARPPRRTGIFVDPDDLRNHVGGLLRTILGGYEVDAFGNFTFTHEGARAFVTVGPSPIGPQVGVFSVTNLDVDLTPQLSAFLLTTNHTLGFGAFSYDTDNRAVWLRHTLHGSSLDLPELQAAVAAVATTAAALDTTIRDRFGGRTFQEAPDDVQRKYEPPETVQPGGAPNAGGYL